MRTNRLRIGLGAAMVLIAVIAVLLTRSGRIDHMRFCWNVAAMDLRDSRSYGADALRYRSCPLVPNWKAQPKYCEDDWTRHVNFADSATPSPDEFKLARTDHERRAVEAENIAAMLIDLAARERWAAWSWSRTLPNRDKSQQARDSYQRWISGSY